MKALKDILNKYGYDIDFQSLHKESDILKYLNKEDAVSAEKFLTFLTPTGHVIGRLFHIHSEKDQLSKDDIQEIIMMFSLYQIPNVKEIIFDLKTVV